LFPAIRLRYLAFVDQDYFAKIAVLESDQRRELADALEQIPSRQDSLFRELALVRVASLLDEAKYLASGDIVFLNTETWRAAYARLLHCADISTYYSVAWMRSSDYWCDQAGRGSIQLNFELLDKGLQIERILILPQALWRNGESAPSAVVRIWMEQQHYRGIRISLVRESDLKGERDLISDFGIYGKRAAGEHEIDEFGRTVRFRLSFSEAAVLRAQERWERLSIFSVPCGQVIDLS
jgi:hypothetical protein